MGLRGKISIVRDGEGLLDVVGGEGNLYRYGRGGCSVGDAVAADKVGLCRVGV